ncbi:Transcriptional regulator, GntR-family [Cupriavidus necator]|jgi:DNA-binding GntR family transcriptional regulator|uniref:Transcriptional regulator, GntR-family n=2 Tax=Cupriavidus necator (strain ATCC 17699 / DSM 428 / KCTC 22496 / NCIMB 10442 / H16 / Stanier 337) TaxID=381666 RepID=Q0K4G0_CUPNH|nr:GntR family transcriptional regulator [Cupriavidus sp. GA3-3]CAJ95114.1 transcriptional regulator, GntR-family [Cupriavidus necator H16]
MQATNGMKPLISAVRRKRGSDVISRLREMAISYELKPGERLNEIELAERLGVSRTPVREALTRLATEGFLVESSRGYVRRPLDIQEMLDLYEARVTIERDCLRLAFERASAESIEELARYLEHSKSVPANTPIPQLVELDEGFHLRIAAMAGNAELKRMLVSLNERIRFIRWIDMENIGRDSTQSEHAEIVHALQAHDWEKGEKCLTSHIALRREQIVEAIAKGLTRIYLAEQR